MINREAYHILREYFSNEKRALLVTGDYERHRALSNIMDNEEYAIPKALVFCQENTQAKGRLVYLPIYMTMFFQHENNDELTYQIDLTGLK